MSSALLKKRITDNFIIINFQNINQYSEIFLAYFDYILVTADNSTFPTILQLFKDNQISSIYYIPDSYKIIQKQIDNSIQLKKCFLVME